MKLAVLALVIVVGGLLKWRLTPPKDVIGSHLNIEDPATKWKIIKAGEDEDHDMRFI
jgi:hypothetical protein